MNVTVFGEGWRTTAATTKGKASGRDEMVHGARAIALAAPRVWRMLLWRIASISAVAYARNA